MLFIRSESFKLARDLGIGLLASVLYAVAILLLQGTVEGIELALYLFTGVVMAAGWRRYVNVSPYFLLLQMMVRWVATTLAVLMVFRVLHILYHWPILGPWWSFVVIISDLLIALAFSFIRFWKDLPPALK